MSLVFTIYSLFFFVTALVSFSVAYLAWQRRFVKSARELSFLMMAAGMGAFWLIFETAAPSMAGKIVLSKLEFVGGIVTPVLYLIFVLRFTGKDKFLKSKYVLLLFLVPVITLGLTITNGLHGLIWSGFSAISEKTNLMEYYHGMGFWIGYIAYSYLLLATAAILVFRFIIHHNHFFRPQGAIVFIGGLCPWIASIIYLNGNNLVPGLDIVPASITLSGILAAYAILNFRFLDLVPVARETLVETLPDGILVLDGQNRIQDINGAALSSLRISKKNPIGYPAESSGSSVPSLLNAVLDFATCDQTEEIRSDHGIESKTYRILKHSIKNHSGSRLVIIRDVTEQVTWQKEIKKSEDNLRRINAEKDKFFSIIAHDLKSPFNAFLGCTEMMVDGLSSMTHDQIQEIASFLSQSANNLYQLLENLLEWSLMQRGITRFDPRTFLLNPLIKNCLEFILESANKKGIEFSYQISDEIQVYADENMLKSTIRNMATNALKFTAKGGKIAIVAKSCTDHGVEISIIDSGMGMDLIMLNQLFRLDANVGRTGTEGEPSTGLGLLLCKDFVEKHGGTIWVESAVGKGSTFNFNLPNQLNRELTI